MEHVIIWGGVIFLASLSCAIKYMWIRYFIRKENDR